MHLHVPTFIIITNESKKNRSLAVVNLFSSFFFSTVALFAMISRSSLVSLAFVALMLYCKALLLLGVNSANFVYFNGMAENDESGIRT